MITVTTIFFCFILFFSSNFGWTLVWEDDFNGASIDNTKWTIRNLFTHGPEGEIYMSDECYLQGGKLILRSQQRNVSGHSYTSCWLDTAGKFAQQFGKVEIKAQLPKGKGMWPAHWLMPNDNSCWPVEGEIDIMEYIGVEPSALGDIYGTLHWSSNGNCGSDKGNGGTYKANGQDFTKDFHVYSVTWDDNQINWFVDDQLYHTTNKTQFNPSHPFFIILNTAVGGGWPGFPDKTTVFPQYHTIEYVRFWK